MYCPACGSAMSPGEQVCSGCGWQEVYQAQPIENDPAMRVLFPVGRSMYAIAAGYFGLFSVIVFPAPIALILGILALRDIKRNPEKGGRGRAIFAIVMGTIFTAALLFFILLAVGAAISES